MADGSLLSLKWNNHVSNFKYTLSQLQQSEQFSDAMIACNGLFFPVHKFVLSTCSEYFADMFEKTPCKHPIIVMKDVSSRDIEFLLSYMYGGEVSVSQSDLPSLVKSAELLRIKGLAAPDDTNDSTQSKSSKRTIPDLESDNDETSSKKVRAEEKLADYDTRENNSDSHVFCNMKSEPESDDELVDVPEFPNINNQESINPPSMNESLFPEVEVKQELEDFSPIVQSPQSLNLFKSKLGIVTEAPSTSWHYANVDKKTASESSMENSDSFSIENEGISSFSRTIQPVAPGNENMNAFDKDSVLGVTTPFSSPINKFSAPQMTYPEGSPLYRCQYPQCSYITHSKSWMEIHTRKHTGVKPYECQYCGFRSAQKGNLNVHIRKIHSKGHREDSTSQGNILIQSSLSENTSQSIQSLDVSQNSESTMSRASWATPKDIDEN